MEELKAAVQVAPGPLTAAIEADRPLVKIFAVVKTVPLVKIISTGQNHSWTDRRADALHPRLRLVFDRFRLADFRPVLSICASHLTIPLFDRLSTIFAFRPADFRLVLTICASV